MQTSISQYGSPAYAGMLDGIGAKIVRSYSAEEAIPVAYPVKLGANPEKGVAKSTSGSDVIGFAVNDGSRERGAGGVVQYNATETVPVLTVGTMWAMTSGPVVAGATANLIVDDGTLTDAPVAAGIEEFTQISVKFLTGTTSAGLALVEIK